MRITISHPHGSLFSYHAARALAEKNWLGSFQSGVAGDGALSRLSPLLPQGSRRRLLNRRFGEIPRESRHSHVCWEALSRMGRRLRPVGLTSRTNWYDVLFCGHDWQVARGLEDGLAAVYAYEDGARRTFEEAGRRSILKVYELPAGYYLGVADELKRAAGERPGLGGQLRPEPAWKRARKDAELKLADLVIVPCEWARRTLRLSPSAPGRVIKVPYGTPADEVEARSARPGGPFTVLFAGQINVRKGVPLLAEAWERLALKDARLLLAGQMNLDGKYLGRLGGASHLGALPRTQLLELMREADLLVFPSLAEGFGLVIGEAMAAGLPVLTTTNTGGPELITEGREGWCVPAHDPRSLAERIEWAYGHRDALYEMGVLARRRAEQWTWADYRRRLGDELSARMGA